MKFDLPHIGPLVTSGLWSHLFNFSVSRGVMPIDKSKEYHRSVEVLFFTSPSWASQFYATLQDTKLGTQTHWFVKSHLNASKTGIINGDPYRSLGSRRHLARRGLLFVYFYTPLQFRRTSFDDARCSLGTRRSSVVVAPDLDMDFPWILFLVKITWRPLLTAHAL